MKPVLFIIIGILQTTVIFAQQSAPVTALNRGSKIVKVAKETTTTVTNTPAFTVTKDGHTETTPSSSTTSTSTKSDTTQEVSKPVRFALIGIGDLSAQTISKINAAGKISFYLKPYSKYLIKKNKSGEKATSNLEFITSIFGSLNVNPINNDTLIEGTILFPDLGNSSIKLTPEIGILSHNPDPTDNHGWSYYYGLLGELSNKQITAQKKKDGADTSVYFNVNSVTFGIKGGLYFQPDEETVLSLTAALYFNYVHIPDKDSADFKYILKQPNLSTNFNSFGCKITFGINDFQIYADVKHTYYNPAEVIPNRGLASFNANMGIVVPVTILKFPK